MVDGSLDHDVQSATATDQHSHPDVGIEMPKVGDAIPESSWLAFCKAHDDFGITRCLLSQKARDVFEHGLVSINVTDGYVYLMMIKAFASHRHCCSQFMSAVERSRVESILEVYEDSFQQYYDGVIPQGGHLQVYHGQRDFDLKAFFVTGNVFLGITGPFGAPDYSPVSTAAVCEPLSGDGEGDGDGIPLGNRNARGSVVDTLAARWLGSLSLG
jgi:hypothetical protein